MASRLDSRPNLCMPVSGQSSLTLISPCAAISPRPRALGPKIGSAGDFPLPPVTLSPGLKSPPRPILPRDGESAYHQQSFHAASFQLQVSLGRKIKTFSTKMVITSGNDEDRGGQEKESKEESVLAMLGIIGTILNLIVIIFVYIYTTL